MIFFPEGGGAEHGDRAAGRPFRGSQGSALRRQDRAPADRHPGDRCVCGDRLCRELERHRALRPQQAGLARDLPGAAERHPLARHLPARVHTDRPRGVRGRLHGLGPLAAGFEREVVAIDGKTLRRSFDRKHEHAPLHLVSAWASEQDLVLGQRCVDDKSNEITAIPELLDRLALQNSIVTVDAMGCQTAIAERILARGADYLLTLKANHPLAHAAVAEHFEQHCFRRGAPARAACDAFDDTPCRLVRRRVFASTEAAKLEALSTWPRLHTVLAVETIRSVNGKPKVEAEIRYFLSSCQDDPATLGRAIRTHWGVENTLHWVLDVTFREDDSRVRDRRAARNLAVLRRIAINLVGRDRSARASVRARRKRAAWNDNYMLQLLAG